jgi:hypothetical protein
MSRRAYCIVLGIAVASAFCPLVRADTLKPSHPDYSWLFDGNLDAHSGGCNGELESPSTPGNWSDDTPFGGPGDFSLDVSNNAVAVSGGFQPGSKGTISMWAKCSTAANNQHLLDSRDGQKTSNTNWVGRTTQYLNTASPNTNEVTLINGLNVGCDTDWAENDFGGTWHHVVIVWNSQDSPAVRIYLDFGDPATQHSVGSATTLASLKSSPTTWYFGRRFGPDANSDLGRWRGKIDEYGFWSVPLAPDEVAWLQYNSLGKLPEPSPPMLALTGLLAALLCRLRRRGTT